MTPSTAGSPNASPAADRCVYVWCMSRTNIDIDDELVGWVMHKYHLPTKRSAVDYALRRLKVDPMTAAELLALRGTGWSGDLEQMRGDAVASQ